MHHLTAGRYLEIALDLDRDLDLDLNLHFKYHNPNATPD